jgi:hypothetical protein
MPADLIPGDGWVTEHLAENGSRTVLPLIAWHIVNGELFPLPKPADASWIIRPRIPDDERLIRVSSQAMQLQPAQPEWSRPTYARTQ